MRRPVDDPAMGVNVVDIDGLAEPVEPVRGAAVDACEPVEGERVGNVTIGGALVGAVTLSFRTTAATAR